MVDERYAVRAFAESNDAIVVFDPASDEIVEVNPRACELLGYRREEILRLQPSAIHPEEIERFERFVDGVLERGRGWTDELACLTHEGTAVDAEVSASAIEVDGRSLVVAIIRDISDRTQRDHELRDRLRRQNALVSLAGAALSSEDMEALLDRTAQLTAEMLGVPRVELLQLREDRTVVFRAGEGWDENLRGTVVGGVVEHTAYTEALRESVVRFDVDAPGSVPVSSRLVDHAVHGGLIVAVRGPRETYGVLAAYATDPRTFGEDEVAFLQTAANVLGGAISRVVAEERLQGLFDSAMDALLFVDDDGRIVEANPAVGDLTGLPNDEIVGSPVWEAVGFADADAGAALWRELLTGDEPTQQQAFTHPDGTKVDVELRAIADVAPGAHLAIVRDVTERNRAQAALVASEERFRTIAEHADDVIYRISFRPEMRYDYLNPAVETVTGYPPEAFYEDPYLYRDIYHPDDVALLESEDLQGLVARAALLRVRHAEGHRIWVEDRRTGIFDEDGRLLGIQGIVRDVSARERAAEATRAALENERRSVEELRALDELKSSFLQAVSHELRTPITAIGGFAQLLHAHHDRLEPARIASFLERLLTNAEQLEGLLDDLLDVERLSRGVTPLDLNDVDLAAVARSAVSRVDLEGRECRVEDREARVTVDAAKIERVIECLVRNAVKHTPPRTTIDVRFRADADRVQLIVEDEGPGVSADLREAIFEPFRQGPQAAGDPSPGTGIGLALVSRLVELHGGRVWVEDHDGPGARFVVDLPREHDASRAEPGRDGGTPGKLDRDAERTVPLGVTGVMPRLLRARSPVEASEILVDVVEELGGGTVPAAEAGELAIPIDVSLGERDPLYPTAAAGTDARRLIETHLPGLVEGAERALALATQAGRMAAASIDPLTGVLDRAAGERILARLDPGAVVAVIDLDGLGSVNERSGRAAGDEVLRAFAGVLRGQVRATDYAARCGDDEFVLVLRDADTSDACRLIDRLRQRWRAARPQPVGFSAGVAPVGGEGGTAAYEAAERALREAKGDRTRDITAIAVP